MLAGLGGWYFKKEAERDSGQLIPLDQSTDASKTQNQSEAGVANVVCNDRPNYYVVSRSRDNFVGNDILVKYKSNETEKLLCVYVPEAGDFEIKSGEPDYFLDIVGTFLILDSGTAPFPRGLIIYDLNRREKIYTDKYSQPLSVEDSAVTYWNPVDTKATNDNCPELTEYLSYGLGAGIEERVTLNLLNLNKEKSGESRCSARQ